MGEGEGEGERDGEGEGERGRDRKRGRVREKWVIKGMIMRYKHTYISFSCMTGAVSISSSTLNRKKIHHQN